MLIADVLASVGSEVVHELRTFFGEQGPVVVSAVTAMAFCAGAFWLLIQYLRGRDDQVTKALAARDAELGRAVESFKDVVTSLQSHNRWTIEAYQQQIKSLSECMRDSLNDLTKSFDRSNHDHAIAQAQAHRETLRELERLTERLVSSSNEALRDVKRELENFTSSLSAS